MFYIMFLCVLMIPLIFEISYILFMRRENYQIKKYAFLFDNNHLTEKGKDLGTQQLKFIFDKVNSWIFSASLYGAFYHLFSIWAIGFALINFYVIQGVENVEQLKQYIMYTSFMSVLSTVLTIMLNCRNFWIYYRETWQTAQSIVNPTLLSLGNSEVNCDDKMLTILFTLQHRICTEEMRLSNNKKE